MATTENPRGWQFNPAIVTLCIVIASMIAGGAYYMGQKDAENRALLQELQSIRSQISAVEQKAEAADTKATYAVAGRDEESGHKPRAASPPKER